MNYKNNIKLTLVCICSFLVYTGCDTMTNQQEGAQLSTGDSDIVTQKNPVTNPCNNWRDEWIFCDDFESDEPLSDRYFEYSDRDGSFVRVEGVGRAGSAGMRARFGEGVVNAGDFKKSIGRSEDPYTLNKSSRPDEDFDEVYWRFDLRHQEGWIGGGGDKLTRAMTLNDDWSQGTIAHIWSMSEDYLGMDPATGIDEDGNLVSTRYNDFDNLRWLGAKRGTTPLFSPENVGEWYSVEIHVKLNTPGESDGEFRFWIDDELQAESTDLNWHGTWNEDPDNYMINAIFMENYWNSGSPVEQERYLDNLIISTERLGPGVSGRTPDNSDI
ncbi:MAG: hypothetical protein WD625_06365 [Balneolales bacterium]